MTSDRDLLTEYRRGSEEAFAEFYDRHHRSLYVYLLSFTRRHEPAEEMLQEVFLSLLCRLEHVQLRADMRPFLLTTARHLAIDWSRRESHGRTALEKRVADPFFRKNSTAPSDQQFDAEEISQLLHDLPGAQREAVVLHSLVGLSFREIAELLDCPENTAVSRYHYGIDKLRRRLRPGEDPEKGYAV